MEYKNCFVKIPDKSAKGYRRLAYLHWGDESNNNVLLCVHGLSRNAHDFDFVARKLSDKYRIISVDIAGRGDSDWIDNKKEYNYATYIHDVLFLIDNLGIKRTSWLGTSMGGIIAMLINSARPDLIEKLILNDVGPMIPGKALDRIIKYVRGPHSFSDRAKAEKFLKIRMSSFGLREEFLPHIFEHSIEQDSKGKYRFNYDIDIIQKPSIWRRLLWINLKHPSRIFKMPDVNLWLYWKKITCPILIIRGAKSDILLKDTCDKMLASNTAVQLAEIENVGHAPMLMEDSQIEIVEKFLA